MILLRQLHRRFAHHDLVGHGLDAEQLFRSADDLAPRAGLFRYEPIDRLDLLDRDLDGQHAWKEQFVAEQLARSPGLTFFFW